MRILFRLDCGRSMGTGHLFRCLGIARHFRSKGWDSQFLINDCEFGEKIVQEFPYETLAFSDIDSEIEAVRERLAGLLFDYIIVDFYDKAENEGLMGVFAEHARRGVLAITDDFRKVYIKSDFLIASEPRQSEYDYGSDRQKVLQGEKYCIVSPEFRSNKITIKRHVTNVLISFGGHDPHNVACDVARNLQAACSEQDLSNVTFHFLLGGLYRYEKELQSILVNSRLTWRCEKDLPSVVPLFLQCDMAISACGNTLFELCHMNMPVVGIGLTDRQHEAGLFMHKRKLIAYAGFYSAIDQWKFNELSRRLMNSREDRVNLHDRCAEHFNLDPLHEMCLLLERGKT